MYIYHNYPLLNLIIIWKKGEVRYLGGFAGGLAIREFSGIMGGVIGGLLKSSIDRWLVERGVRLE